MFNKLLTKKKKKEVILIDRTIKIYRSFKSIQKQKEFPTHEKHESLRKKKKFPQKNKEKNPKM